MKELKFEPGDTAYLHMPHHKGELTKGKVLMKLALPGYSFIHYVIEIPTSIDPLLEIRCGHTLSDHKNRPIGMLRR